MKLKIKKEDLVQVIAGNDKGIVGRVLRVYPKTMRILVEGVNIRKKHMRPNQQNQQGGIKSKEIPVHYSNVMLIDSDKVPTKVSIERTEKEDGKIVVERIAKSNGKKI
jgi:large subunit ribosomal protein L24